MAASAPPPPPPLPLLTSLLQKSTALEGLSLPCITEHAALSMWESGANLATVTVPRDDPVGEDLARLIELMAPAVAQHAGGVERTLLHWATESERPVSSTTTATTVPASVRLMPLRCGLALAALVGGAEATARLRAANSDRGRIVAACVGSVRSPAAAQQQQLVEETHDSSCFIPSVGVVLPILEAAIDSKDLSPAIHAHYLRGFLVTQLVAVQWVAASSAQMQQRLEALLAEPSDSGSPALLARCSGVLEGLLALALSISGGSVAGLPGAFLDLSAVGRGRSCFPSAPLALCIARLIRGSSSLVTQGAILAQRWRAVFGSFWAQVIDNVVFGATGPGQKAPPLSLLQRDVLLCEVFPATLTQLGYEFLWQRWERKLLSATAEGGATEAASRARQEVDVRDILAALAPTTFPARLRLALPERLRRFLPLAARGTSPLATARLHGSKIATPVARIAGFLRSHCGLTAAEVEIAVDREIATLPEVLELVLLTNSGDESLRAAKKAQISLRVLLAGTFLATHSPKFGRCLSLFESLAGGLALLMAKTMKKSKAAASQRSLWHELAVEIVLHTRLSEDAAEEGEEKEAAEWAAEQFLQFVLQWYVKSLARPPDHAAEEADLQRHLLGFVSAEDLADVFDVLIFQPLSSPGATSQPHVRAHLSLARHAARNSVRLALFAQLAALNTWAQRCGDGSVLTTAPSGREWGILAMDIRTWCVRLFGALHRALSLSVSAVTDGELLGRRAIESALLLEHALVCREYGLGIPPEVESTLRNLHGPAWDRAPSEPHGPPKGLREFCRQQLAASLGDEIEAGT